MKSNYIKNTIVVNITFFTLLMFYSCDRFTDVGLPKSQITRDVVFNDDELAKSAMAAVYRSAYETGFISGGTSGAQILFGTYADELQSYASATSDATIFYQLSHLASATKINSLWTATYTQLYNINSIIEGVENSENLSLEVKNRLKGEALFMRSILHLYLVQTYGAIPYVNSTSYEVNQSIGKSNITTVYNLCKSDLQAAANLLPATLPAGNRIYPTKMAAYTLLARIAYYEKNWEDAVQYSTMVITNTLYKMETDLNKVFLKDSTGSIFQLLPFNSTSSTSTGNVFILNTAPPTNVALRQDFVNEFESGDGRKTSWIGQKTDSQGQIYYYPYKYKQFTTGPSSTEYSVVLRVEELYLIRAEAYIQKNQYDLAVADLNKVRNRAGLPSLAVTTDPMFLNNALLKERRCELFTEFGHRFFDLRHHNLLDVVMSSKKTNWKPYFRLLPLPEKELLLNPNLNPQNEGY
ncbi:RagB/SusD family nutrient uptake outer membrane protein [Chryseobacterium sp. Ch-15]|uniref:RagB/SusD family nutrient uptake outer membrane protein n=2 Tax=Chryseobacterium muglaense TaxID=2893752 RepID=A0ABR8M7B6_9FLAO|nr:RagB/SusD family nutrient uptake outer membrane protein [Chryseobacterium muglaense]MBD3905407.1 RagB/SusD family nutrient uptake outer membrane protein [Chryseobacterium muglaense]MCM2555270.1 RagB/SusD family nutrient uptake outer membrane protein [Chryseobacterium muglaense]